QPARCQGCGRGRHHSRRRRHCQRGCCRARAFQRPAQRAAAHAAAPLATYTGCSSLTNQLLAVMRSSNSILMKTVLPSPGTGGVSIGAYSLLTTTSSRAASHFTIAPLASATVVPMKVQFFVGDCTFATSQVRIVL